MFAWGGFLLFVFVMLALDLGVVNRNPHVVSVREALVFTMIVATIAAAFSVFVYFAYENHWLELGNHVDGVDGRINDGRLAAVKYFTGYVIEVSLSADNVFVITIIFQHLKVPGQFQHRVLFWGILGALAMRGAMIVLGAQLVERYHWVLYLFGVFLIFTAARMLFGKEDEEAPEESIVVRQLKRLFPVTNEYEGQRFSLMRDGRRLLTPLAVALVLVETTDLVFALDSIPAIFAITTDPFLVFTSNVFAILGLRSLYFALAGAMDKFRYLKASLAAILGPDFNFLLLGIVALILGTGVVASVIAARREGGQTNA
jgi:tellurite resistance protein TerC